MTERAVQDATHLDAQAVQWRQLTPSLWVGRYGDAHLGQVERGHGFEVSDGEGHVLGRCRRLAEAQALLADLHPCAHHLT